MSWKDDYPFEPRRLTLPSPHPVSLSYVDRGQGDVLLMVHGNPTWSFYWRRLISHFSASYRTVAVDHVGCGLSDKPQDYPYCLDQHIDNLVYLIEQLDLRRITLLVHDWGGAIGLGAALRVPRRVGRLVMFNTAAFPPPYIPWRIRACRIPWLGTWAIRGGNLFARAALWMAVERRASLTKNARTGLVAPYDSWANRVAIDRFVQDIPTTAGQATWQRLAAIEAGLTSLADRPVQLIWGMRDWCFTPACLTRLEEHFPAAQVLRLDRVGHYVVEEGAPEIIRQLERFFVDHPPLAEAEPAR